MGEMMDLGIYTAEAESRWEYTMGVLTAIDEQSTAQRPLRFEPDSPVDDLVRVFPDAPVDLRCSVIRGLDTSLDSVQQLHRYLTGQAPTTPIIIGTLMRSVLLPASRVVFLLGPTDADARRDHALLVLRQESDSLGRHFKAAKDLQKLEGLVPPPDVLTGQMARIQAVREATSGFSESKMLAEMTDVVAGLLAASEFADEVTSDLLGALNETITLAFQAYSGIAHGHAWPCTIPRTDSNLPIQFPTDLLILASICQMALQLFVGQSAPSTV